MSTARVDFTRGAAERIARVVRIVEQGARDQTGPTWKAPIDEGSQRVVFRVCTFSGDWTKNTTKVVTLKYQTATPNTFVATNLFANIGTSASTARNCAISREGTAWFLVAAEC